MHFSEPHSSHQFGNLRDGSDHEKHMPRSRVVRLMAQNSAPASLHSACSEEARHRLPLVKASKEDRVQRIWWQPICNLN